MCFLESSSIHAPWHHGTVIGIIWRVLAQGTKAAFSERAWMPTKLSELRRIMVAYPRYTLTIGIPGHSVL